MGKDPDMAGIHEIFLPSALFPFTLSDLPCFSYGEFRLENVFGKTTDGQRQAAEQIWTESGITTPAIARERSAQICYLMTEIDGGRLIGVNTLYRDRLVADGPECFFNRMFILPGHRHSRLMIVGTAATLFFALTRLAGEGLPGIVNENVNPKLARPGMRRIFERLGYRYMGRYDNREVWYFDFAGVRLNSG